MKITDFVREELIVPDLRSRDKAGVIGELAERLSAADPTLDRSVVVRVLMEREKLASTAIGEGVAIPHGKLTSAQKLIGCIGRSVHGVEFQSIDGRPTHLFFLLIAPESSTGAHLKALARISRIMKSSEFRDRLLKAGTRADIFNLIVEEDAKY